jgi:hypothetical protein
LFRLGVLGNAPDSRFAFAAIDDYGKIYRRDALKGTSPR